MFLHLSPLLECEWPVFQEKARWESDLPDVMDEAAEVGTFLNIR